MEGLPLVPFGKYKGQPITVLYSDPKYLNWLKAQDWFTKSPIYNITVNQIITTQSSKTPEHNRLQKLFLNSDFTRQFLTKIYPIQPEEKICNEPDVEFEGKFNWDLIIKNITRFTCICISESVDSNNDCTCKYKDSDDRCKRNIYCEIKPAIGDDYPAILRKMSTQKELTDKYLDSEKNERLKNLGYTTQGQGRFGIRTDDWEEVKGIKDCRTNVWNIEYTGKYILLVEKLTTNEITKEEIIKIFNQKNIDVVFMNDLHLIHTEESINSISTIETKEKRRCEIEKQIADLKKELENL